MLPQCCHTKNVIFAYRRQQECTVGLSYYISVLADSDQYSPVDLLWTAHRNVVLAKGQAN